MRLGFRNGKYLSSGGGLRNGGLGSGLGSTALPRHRFYILGSCTALNTGVTEPGATNVVE